MGRSDLRFAKDPAIAVLLSFVCTGLGQLYNGQYFKAAFMMLAYGVAWALTFALVGWLFLPFIWLGGMFDAHASAQRINERLAREGWV